MAGGAYIKIKDGNIYIHAPGIIEHKGAAHPFMGPTQMQFPLPDLPAAEGYTNRLDAYHLFAGKKDKITDIPYMVVKEDNSLYAKGTLDKTGRTTRIYSDKSEKVKVFTGFAEIIDLTPSDLNNNNDSESEMEVKDE